MPWYLESKARLHNAQPLASFPQVQAVLMCPRQQPCADRGRRGQGRPAPRHGHHHAGPGPVPPPSCLRGRSQLPTFLGQLCAISHFINKEVRSLCCRSMPFPPHGNAWPSLPGGWGGSRVPALGISVCRTRRMAHQHLEHCLTDSTSYSS